MPAWRLIGLRGAAELVGLVAAAVAFIWAARIAGPSAMGDLAVATAVSQLGFVFISGGTASTAPRLVASALQPPSDTWWVTVAIRLIPACGLVLLLLATVALAHASGAVQMYSGAIIAAWLMAPLRSDWLLVAKGDLAGASVSRAISMLAMASVVLTLIRDPTDTALLPLFLSVPGIVYPLAATVLCFARGSVQAPPRVTRGVEVARAVLDGAWHYVAADVSAFIYSGFDRLILYAVASPTATGLYDAAYRVIQPIYLVSAVANDAMFRPLALATGEAAKAVMRRYALLMLGLTAPVGAFMTIFAAFIVHALYGDAFTDAAPILGILGWVISIGFISGSMILPMVAWGQSATYARATAFGAITSVAANVVLIPTMAGVGAAIAATVAKAASGVVARPTFDSRSPVKIVELARPFAIAVAAAALSAYLTGMLAPTAIAVLVFALAYGLVLATALNRRTLRVQVATDS